MPTYGYDQDVRLSFAVMATPRMTRLRAYRDGRPFGAPFEFTTMTDPDAFIGFIAKAILAFIARTPGASVVEVGLAVAGQLDQDRHHIVRAGRLQTLVHRPLADMLSRALGGARVSLGNDAFTKVYYEGIHNPAVSGLSFFGIYIGEGFGSAFSLIGTDGKRETIEVEAGHIKVPGTNKRIKCPCGGEDHLDVIAGGRVLGSDPNLTPTCKRAVWLPYVGAMAAVISMLLKERPVDRLLIGGQRTELHPRMRFFLKEAIEELMGDNTPQFARSVLHFAPAEAASVLFKESDLVSAGA